MRILTILFAGVLGTGCYATTSGGYGGTVTATTIAPDLVYVSPGVQVIADYDEPVFYADGYYWRETGGTWYRSSNHTHGWSYYAPPRAIIGIRDRHVYRNYRPAGYTPRRDRAYQPRDRAYQPRDNRSYQPRDNNRGAYQPENRGAYQPRDNNRGAYQPENRRDDRKDRRDERKEDRKDRKEDRKEDRKDRR
ncbi:MAG: hypothetical protein H0V17_23315 [Deltaproteobacteria bacterium]|nr:hypothetical protein [Deltaproteobacteria bacterium]